MICRDVEEIMIAHLASNLSLAEETELERHLAACPACHRVAESIRESYTALKMAYTGVQPPDLTTRVLSRAREGERLAPARWVPALAGGVLLLFMAVGIFLGRPAGISDPELLQAYAEDLTVLASNTSTTDAYGWSTETEITPYGYITDAELQL